MNNTQAAGIPIWHVCSAITNMFLHLINCLDIIVTSYGCRELSCDLLYDRPTKFPGKNIFLKRPQMWSQKTQELWMLYLLHCCWFSHYVVEEAGEVLWWQPLGRGMPATPKFIGDHLVPEFWCSAHHLVRGPTIRSWNVVPLDTVPVEAALQQAFWLYRTKW